MTKLSIGLLAAVAIAIATVPADAAKKKKAKMKKETASVSEVHPPLRFVCGMNWFFGAKQPPACGG
jgi:hypothetical protein